MSADKCTICDLNKPLEEAIPMKSNFQCRTELFSKNTKRDYIQVLLEFCSQNGLFSNMDKREIESFQRFKERAS